MPKRKVISKTAPKRTQSKSKPVSDTSSSSYRDSSENPMSIEDIEEECSSNFTKFTTRLLKIDYLAKIFEEGNSDKYCYCTICDIQILCNNFLKHIQTNKHRNNTPEADRVLLDQSIFAYRKSTGDDPHQEFSANKGIEETRDYLEFIAFLMSLKLSYSQIEKVGFYLKDYALKKRLEFLKKFAFSQEVISKIASECFCPYFKEKILEDISVVAP